MAPREWSLAELAEDLAETRDELRADSKATRARIDELIQTIDRTYMRQDVYQAKHEALVVKVDKIEDRHTWLSRTAITALILPIVVGVFLAIMLSTGAGP